MKAMPASLDMLFDMLGFLGVKSRPAGTVDRLARIARGQDRQGPYHCGDKMSTASMSSRRVRSRKPSTAERRTLRGLFGAMADLIADGPNLETIGQPAKSGAITLIPASPSPISPTRNFMRYFRFSFPRTLLPPGRSLASVIISAQYHKKMTGE